MTITQTGLILDIVGASLIFADSIRVSSRFSKDGVSLGYGDRYSRWYWHWCGRVGAALLLIGFWLQYLGSTL